MSKNKSHRNCLNFKSKDCPHFDDALMKQLISDTTVSAIRKPTIKDDLTDFIALIDKTYCSVCDNFLSRS